jgi:hypothetical protein
MAQYSTTFSGQTTGANATNFTDRYDAETAVSIENPAIGETDSRVLQFGTGDTGDIFQSFSDQDADANRDNIEILARFRQASDEQRACIMRVRASGTSGTKTAYDAYINDDDFTLTRWNSGSSTILTSSPTERLNSPFTLRNGDDFTRLPANTWLWCRFRVNGTGATVTLQAKWWLDGYSEPEDWLLEFDDTSGSRITAAGWNGFAKRVFGGNTYLDIFTAGTNGDVAPHVAGGADMRVSQIAANALVQPDDVEARITAANVGALIVADDAQARVTYARANAIYVPTDAEFRVSQTSAQVMYKRGAVAPSGTQAIQCIIMT